MRSKLEYLLKFDATNRNKNPINLLTAIKKIVVGCQYHHHTLYRIMQLIKEYEKPN